MIVARGKFCGLFCITGWRQKREELFIYSFLIYTLPSVRLQQSCLTGLQREVYPSLMGGVQLGPVFIITFMYNTACLWSHLYACVCFLIAHVFFAWLIAAPYQAGDMKREHVYQCSSDVCAHSSAHRLGANGADTKYIQLWKWCLYLSIILWKSALHLFCFFHILNNFKSLKMLTWKITWVKTN